MPPIAPDGGPVLTPPAKLPVVDAGQGVCTDGPRGVCARYHRLVISMDAQQPIDGSGEVEHHQVVHTCYPHPGIELDLSGQHVYECSRYTPELETTQLVNATKRALAQPSTLSTPPRAAPRSARAPQRKRRPGRR